MIDYDNSLNVTFIFIKCGKLFLGVLPQFNVISLEYLRKTVMLVMEI